MVQQQACEVVMYSRELALDLNRHTLDLNSKCQQDFGGVGDVKKKVVVPPFPGVSRSTNSWGDSGGVGGGPSTVPPTNWTIPIHGMYANPSNLNHHHHHVLASSSSPSMHQSQSQPQQDVELRARTSRGNFSAADDDEW